MTVDDDENDEKVDIKEPLLGEIVEDELEESGRLEDEKKKR